MTVRAYFATSSDIKFQQYAHIAAALGITILRGMVISSALMEPQGSSNDVRQMSNLVFHPLRLSARFIATSGQLPYFVEDTMLVIDGLSNHGAGHIGLPGPDTKNLWLNLGASGLLDLIAGLQNRSARFICQIGVLYGAGNYSYHQAETRGFITRSVRINDNSHKMFPATNPHFFHSIFGLTPDGPSLAELDSETFPLYDYRKACFEKFGVELRRNAAAEALQATTAQLEFFE